MALSAVEQTALLVAVGLVAGAINTVAGGGSLLTIPALIFLGLPAPVANATNRVSVLLQALTATQQFHKRGLLPVRKAVLPLVWASLGAAGGAWLGASIEAGDLERVIGVLMLVMLVILVLDPKRWLHPAEQPAPAWLQAGVFFFVGAYGGFLQAGVGFFLLFALAGLGGWDLVSGNGAKSLIAAVFTLPALVIFISQDLVRWGPGLGLAAGSVVGAWLGTRLAVGWGPRFVRAVLVVMVATASSKLLGLW